MDNSSERGCGRRGRKARGGLEGRDGREGGDGIGGEVIWGIGVGEGGELGIGEADIAEDLEGGEGPLGFGVGGAAFEVVDGGIGEAVGEHADGGVGSEIFAFDDGLVCGFFFG